MEDLLNAANTNPDKFIIGKLPVKPNDVSIIKIEDLYDLLDRSKANGGDYYVYGIVGADGKDSTSDNLKSVGVSWYMQKYEPTTYNCFWINVGVSHCSVFGGLLYGIGRTNNYKYNLRWYYAEGVFSYSDREYYWRDCVDGDVYVAVVRAR